MSGESKSYEELAASGKELTYEQVDKSLTSAEAIERLTKMSEFPGWGFDLKASLLRGAAAITELLRQTISLDNFNRLRLERPDHRNNGKYQFVKGWTGGGAEACVHLTSEEIAERCARMVGPGTLEDDGIDLWWVKTKLTSEADGRDAEILKLREEVEKLKFYLEQSEAACRDERDAAALAKGGDRD